MGYSPWGCKESDMTELAPASKGLTVFVSGHFAHSFIELEDWKQPDCPQTDD